MRSYLGVFLVKLTAKPNPFSTCMAFILRGSVCESLLRRLCSGGVFIVAGRRADRPACVESVSAV